MGYRDIAEVWVPQLKQFAARQLVPERKSPAEAGPGVLGTLRKEGLWASAAGQFRAQGLVPEIKAPPSDGAKCDGGATGTLNPDPTRSRSRGHFLCDEPRHPDGEGGDQLPLRLERLWLWPWPWPWLSLTVVASLARRITSGERSARVKNLSTLVGVTDCLLRAG